MNRALKLSGSLNQYSRSAVCKNSSIRARAMSGGAAARPLSPHLAIYKFRINMVTSVLFRGTGILMVGGLGALAIAGTVAPSGSYNALVYNLQQYPAANALVKFGASFALAYHYFGGLRHIAWDNVIGNNVQHSKQTGLAATGAAVAVSLIAAATSYPREK